LIQIEDIQVNIARTPQQFIAIMAISVIGVLMLAMWLLYDVSLELQRQRLVETVQSNARLIEAIAHHEVDDARHVHDNSTLEQVAHAHSTFPGFGNTGEFVLAQRDGDSIEFLLRHRHGKLDKPQAIPFNASLAEPMRRALQNKSGTLIGLDYRGEQVLAAHEPISIMGWGIVAKIDMAEIRAPFITAAIFSALAAVIIIILGSWLILRLTSTITKTLQEARAHQKNLFELSPIGLALCDMDGEMVEVNPAYAEIIGRTPEEAISLSYWDLTPAKYEQEEKAQLQLLRETGRYGPYEKEYIHNDGYLVPVRLSGKIIEKDGEQYIWSSVEDISDKVCAEKRLHQAAAVFENTDEGIVITDENNRITMINSAFSEITGYSEEDALGQNPRMLSSGRHDNAFYKSLWHHLEQKDRWRGEMWNRRKDGSIIPVWQQIAVIHNASGAVSNYVSIFSDISELKAVEHQLAHLAHHDELTGLPNRLYFKAHVEQSMQSARRNQHMMALLYLDLDGFKQINDTFGHDVGDQLLKVIASRLKGCVREEDTVARMGGDEFIIILNKINSRDDASLVAGNIVREVNRPLQLTKHTLSPTTSIGISIYPSDAESVSGLQKAADHAMYLAKARGKNSYKFFAQQV
jgi:diguanylate cyclase (GGDEF)-like protein/PAS domain S-box-containing protein